MAKHPHRLLLQQKKTWRCTLPGCTFFVHLGLAHILIGKSAACWECGETFTLDEDALKEEMPKCMDCRDIEQGKPTATEIGEYETVKNLLIKAGFSKMSDVPPDRRRGWIQMKFVTAEAIDRFLEYEEDRPISE